MFLSKRQRVLVGVGGGIAAYKVCEVVSQLAQAGYLVRCIYTAAAEQFIAPLTLATLSRQPAYGDRHFWSADQGRPLHIELGEWADVILLAPLTANTLAKLACGLADNLLANTVLASRCPVLLAPAMNTDMWEQVAVQSNWQQVQRDPRYHAIAPGAGRLACDRVGSGRLAEPPELIAAVESLLLTGGERDLAGQTVLITAGSTREHLDPVRFLGNPSTGKMGIALARAALHRGARVVLIHGPLAVELPSGQLLESVAVTSAAQMRAAVLEYCDRADWLVMAAAVADVRPTSTAREKLPKHALPAALPLEPVPDIAAELGQRRQPHQRFVGFAAQTGEVAIAARDKLQRKGFDAIAANPIDQPGTGFGSETNRIVLLGADGRQQALPLASKLAIAHQIFDFVQGRQGNRKSNPEIPL